MEKLQFNRPLPNNLDAERAVLGAILVDNHAINEAIEHLNEEDFHEAAHSLIFITMQELIDEDEKVDIITLTNRLNQKKKLTEVGGPSYLTALIDAVPTAVNIAYHADIVAQKSLSRQLLSLSNRVLNECMEDGDAVGSILDRAEKDLFALGEKKIKSHVVHIGEALKDNIDRIDQLYQQKEPITGIPSGFHDLDNMTSGFQRSDLIILAARPSVGKTSFLLNVAEHIAVTNKTPLLIFSLEMSTESLINRFLCSQARIDSRKLRTGMLNQDDWDRLKGAADTLFQSQIYIDETPGINILEMRAKARRAKTMYGIEIIFVDYLQLIHAVGRLDSRQQEISQISGSLKALAKELSVPVFVCSQLSRDIEKRKEKEPKLSDLRESGSIEQDADLIGFLHRPEVDDGWSIDGQSSIVEFVLGKHRNGPIGNFRMVFLNKYTQFKSMAQDHQNIPDGHDHMDDNDDGPPPF